MKNSKKKILIVEDAEIAAKAAQFILEMNECQVVTAGNGKQALKILDKSFDCVLVDLGLPDISGIELIKKIRENAALPSSLPIWILTSDYDHKDKFSALKTLNVTEVIPKPFTQKVCKTFLKSLKQEK